METETNTSNAPAVLSKSLGATVGSTPILMVGAGGIGCELLKNLVLSGFKNITIIDLDTIDVTNLNRQFLFHREHVGKSKAEVAKESAIAFVPDAKITAIHGSVTTEQYNVKWYKDNFKLVLNALDNKAARSHVNKMCLAANLPLIESGTSGYLGQVTVIRRGETECYDCNEKPHQKTFPGCTIRNTPSEPIHCIVWSKHLFTQLFGEADSDKDVSPDSEDPELKEKESNEKDKESAEKDKESAEKDNDSSTKDKETGSNQEKSETTKEKIRLRDWATENEYEPKKVFQKLFFHDINVLLEMKDLWAKRTPPTPLEWDKIVEKEDTANDSSANSGGIKDQKMWSLRKCRDVFEQAVTKLKDKLKAKDYKDDLVWDKDDEEAMDFVAACANIRAHIFGIAMKTRFDIKSMAGNIIPAIATTNAVIAGCIVMEALKVLNNDTKRAKNVFLKKTPNPRRQILVTEEPVLPKPKCPICTSNPEAHVRVDLEKMTLRMFEDQILKKGFAMISPDAETTDSKVLLSSDKECPTDPAMYEKTLKAAGLVDGAQLICEDFLQDYKIKVFFVQCTDLPDGKEFQIIGDYEAAIKAEQEKKSAEAAKAKEEEEDEIQMVQEEANKTEASKSDKPETAEKMETDENQKKRVLDQNDNSKEEEVEAKKPRADETKSTNDVEAA